MVDTQGTRCVAMAEGLMTVEGLPEPFVQGIKRPLRLVATGLRPVGGFSLRDGQMADSARIEGGAALLGGRLMRAGFPGEAGTLALTIRPLAAAAEPRALLILRFEESEDEPEGAYLAEIYAPPVMFEGLASAIGSGQAQTLSITAATSLWVRESEREATPGLPVAWHLGLDDEGRGSLPARGLVETLEWHPSDTREAEPAVSLTPEGNSEDQIDATADLLARINWSLKQIALVLMFLLIVVALK